MKQILTLHIIKISHTLKKMMMEITQQIDLKWKSWNPLKAVWIKIFLYFVSLKNDRMLWNYEWKAVWVVKNLKKGYAI